MPFYKRKRSYSGNASTSKRYRSRGPKAIRRSRRRYLPSRVYGRKTYNRTQRIVNTTLRSIAESKFRGYSPEQCIEPRDKPAGDQPISYHFFNTGTDLSHVLPEFPADSPVDPTMGEMNLYEFPQGDGKTERIGASMYIKHTHIKIEVQMKHKLDIATPGNPTVSFRMMVLKAKRSLDKFGEYPDPGDSMLLSSTNTAFGYDSTGQPTFMHMNQPINKRKWSVYKDMKFTLSAPYQQQAEFGEPAQTFVNSKFPQKKLVNIKLPIGKKCNFDNRDTPSNLDTQWFIILQAVNTNYCEDILSRPQNYFVNICGTTSALDN